MKNFFEIVSAVGRLVRGYVVQALASEKMPGAKKQPVTVADVDEALREMPWFDNGWLIWTSIALTSAWVAAVLVGIDGSPPFGQLVFGLLLGRLLVLPVLVLMTARSAVECRMILEKSQVELEESRAAHNERMKKIAADHEVAMDEIRDPGGRMAAAMLEREIKEKEEEAKYLAIGAGLSEKPHYDDALNIALAVINGRTVEAICAGVNLEAVELAQELICAYSKEDDIDPFANSYNISTDYFQVSLFRARTILSGQSRPTAEIFSKTGLSILANHRDALAPQIAALRIQRAMKSRIDAATELSGTAVSESVSPAPSRRRSICI